MAKHEDNAAPGIPIVTLDADGRVQGLNAAAKAVFGDAVGRRCGDVVVAKDGSYRAICNSQCAKELVCHGEEADHGTVWIRREPYHLVCTGIRDHGVVFLLDAEPEQIEAERLSPRELEILSMVAEGLTTKRIARRLGVSFATVRTHLERLRAKLGAKSRAEAVARAIQTGQL
ncbi:MAG: helix-turn-helix transcriptional regulator [Myxococcota bacterium]|jgi:DNA-binding CsgD family transcriptional regulator|nr:helix-turn-helix transcriptional regulator [Myxococcota bacterium]